MKMLAIVFMSTVSLVGCATQREFLSWPFDEPGPTWKVGDEEEVRGEYYIIEFIREGDDIENWKELVTLQNFLPSWGGSSPEDAYNSLKTIREKECPGSTEWNVISTSTSRILYEWQAKPCMGWPDQHELATIIFGKNNRFVLRYTVKTKQIDPEQRSKWIDVLSRAEIRTEPPKD